MKEMESLPRLKEPSCFSQCHLEKQRDVLVVAPLGLQWNPVIGDKLIKS